MNSTAHTPHGSLQIPRKHQHQHPPPFNTRSPDSVQDTELLAAAEADEQLEDRILAFFGTRTLRSNKGENHHRAYVPGVLA
jgi:hypothetical protein